MGKHIAFYIFFSNLSLEIHCQFRVYILLDIEPILNPQLNLCYTHTTPLLLPLYTHITLYYNNNTPMLHRNYPYITPMLNLYLRQYYTKNTPIIVTPCYIHVTFYTFITPISPPCYTCYTHIPRCYIHITQLLHLYLIICRV